MNTAEMLLKSFIGSHEHPVYIVHKASGKYNLCLPTSQNNANRTINHNGKTYSYLTSVHRSFDTVEEMTAYVESVIPETPTNYDKIFNYTEAAPKVKPAQEIIDGLGLPINVNAISKRRNYQAYRINYSYRGFASSVSPYSEGSNIYDSKGLVLGILYDLCSDFFYDREFNHCISLPLEGVDPLENLAGKTIVAKRTLETAIQFRDLFLDQNSKNYISWVKQFFASSRTYGELIISPCVDRMWELGCHFSLSSKDWLFPIPLWAKHLFREIVDDPIEKVEVHFPYQFERFVPEKLRKEFMDDVRESYRVYRNNKEIEVSNWFDELKGRIAS